ncbi:unnamed protein product [Adineta steineri]|uniref:Nuclear receptor domain-containing protein n=2 Tax=Adineta steineri TaxID=433720 RepID=A0A814KKA5_9BILA|nr:unnamed protein product [Adineta steineri]
MESGSSPSFIKPVTCMMLESRALCVVCGAPAIGRNFDAYTCLSCKAFFRRNAYNDHIRFTCRISGSCEITILTRRHCSACRLNKCFQQGMKKELIRSLVAINQATPGTIINRHHHEQQPLSLTTMNVSPPDNQRVLLFTDWNLLTNIRNAYEDYCIEQFLASHQKIPLSIATQPYRSRIKLQRLVDIKLKYITVLISFIKRILQCNPSTGNNYEYIKDNFSTLLTINTSELMKSNVLKNAPWEYDRCLFESVITENLLKRADEHLNVFETFLPYDPLIIKTFLIILALSSRTSPLFGKERYNPIDFHPFPKELILAQNYYLMVFWKYAIYRLGYYETVIYSVRFIQHFLRRQNIEAEILDVIRNRDDQGQLAGLFETTLNI